MSVRILDPVPKQGFQDSTGWRCLLVFSTYEATQFSKEGRKFSHRDIPLGFKDREQALLFNSIGISSDKYCGGLEIQYCHVYNLPG